MIWAEEFVLAKQKKNKGNTKTGQAKLQIVGVYQKLEATLKKKARSK